MNQTKKIKTHIVFQIILFILLIAADRITKLLAVNNLKGKTDIQLITNILSFHYLENNGAAFGIFKDRTWLFILVTVIVLCCISFIFIWINVRLIKHAENGNPVKPRTYSGMVFLDYVLVLLEAGAIGNFIDRLLNKYVVDFIYFEFINFPVFNFADICVVSAAAALIIFFIFIYKDDEEFHIFSRK